MEGGGEEGRPREMRAGGAGYGMDGGGGLKSARIPAPHSLFPSTRSQRQLFYVSFFKPRFNSCSQSV